MTQTCSSRGCGRNAKVRGMCLSCYGHAWRKGTIPIKRYKARRWAALEPPRPPTTQELLAMMDPTWYVPEWNIRAGKLPTVPQINTRKRLAAFQKATGFGASDIARIVGWYSPDIRSCLAGNYHFPSLSRSKSVNAALDEYERQHPPTP